VNVGTVILENCNVVWQKHLYHGLHMITQPVHVLPRSNSAIKCNNGANRILSITCSNQRFNNCSPTVDIGFVKFTSDSFCGNRVFKMNIQLCCPVTCAAVVLWLLETFLLTVYIDFRPLFVFAGVIFPWFVYVDITLETVAFDTPSNVADFITDSAAKRVSTICPLLKSDKSLDFRHFTRTVTQNNH
jgi:hypothetical protein